MGMMANVLVFSVLLFASRASSSREAPSGTNLDVDAGLSRRFNQWMVQYGRVYGDENEKEKRFQIFKKNVAYIEAHNDNKEKTHTLGITMFADLTKEEFSATYARCGSKRAPFGLINRTFKYENVTDVPWSIDWQQRGAVTSVKHQGRCGSCWSFAAVASVEGLMKINKGNLVELSTQQLVDCTTHCGCIEGWVDDGLNYAKMAGLSKEKTYPYTGVKGTCNTRPRSVAFIKGYERVPSDEIALVRAVAHQPVAVSVDTKGEGFQHYTGGVYRGPCGADTDHSVAIVGYGMDPDGTMYWVLKNSWGTNWGEGGYMRMMRHGQDPRGLCGIALHAFYPTV